MRNPLEARRPVLRSPDQEAGYDDGRRAACRSLLAGPVRAGAARRLVELVLVPREHPAELEEIFDEVDRLAGAPSLAGAARLPELTAVAARAAAAHTCRGTRSLGASLAAISAGIDRRFVACEAGEAGYPLTLAGLGAAGRYGLENNLSPVYLTHTLERIVESAVLLATVVDPACAPGAYTVRSEPRASTTAAVRAVLGDHLARQQNATIDFALEELTSRYWREPAATDHLQCLLLAVRGPIDIGQLVAAGHSLLAAVSDDVEIEAELAAAAGILDGSGLTCEGALALGGAVAAITGLAASLVPSLAAAGTAGGAGGSGTGRGAGSGGDEHSGAGSGLVSRSPSPLADPWPSPAGARPFAGRRLREGGRSDSGDLARSVLRTALVVAWCAEHGRIRPGTITLARRCGSR